MTEHKHPDYPISNLIRSISLKMKYNADKKVLDIGFNAEQGRMIGYIYAHQVDGIIQKDLADAFQKTEASITSMLQGLEKKGCIVRKVTPENERQKRIYVLPETAKLISEFYKSFEDAEENIASLFTKEEKYTLLALLTKIDSKL